MNELEKVSEYFDHWNELKKELHVSGHRPYFREREVWWASIGHNIGDEQNDKDGVIILSQGRVIDAKRLIRRIETMDEASFNKVVAAYKDLI